MRTLVTVLLCCTPFGCPSRDNPHDPGRCDPRCTGGEVCYNGSCVGSDGGSLDGGSDAGPNGGPAITYSVRPATSTPATTESGSWTDIPGLAAQTVTANGKDRYLVILNVLHSWLDVNEKGAGFRLTDNGAVLATGYYTAQQWVARPITLFAAKQLSAGVHTIKAQWRIDPAASPSYKLNLGKDAKTWLVVVRAGEHDLVSTTGNFPSKVKSSSSSYENIPGLDPLTINAAGQHLLVLNAPATSVWTKAYFRIVVEGTGQVLAGAAAGAARNGLGLPVTVVGVHSFTKGQQIRAQWLPKDSSLESCTDGATLATWLIALREPGVAYAKGSSSAQTASGSFSEITTLSPRPLKVTSAGGNHLLILSAPYTHLQPSTTWVAGTFQILVDGTSITAGGCASIQGYDYLPVTVVGVKDLPAGTQHSVTAEWSLAGGTSGSVHLGGVYPHWLIDYAR